MRSHIPRRSSQRGFTLLEIMIVVVIIGILVTGAVLSLGAVGKDSGLQQERDRLSALIAYGRERGAMLTLEYGIRCGQHGYRFVYYDNRLMRWTPETVDETLRARKLPAGLQLELTIEGHQIVLDDKALKIGPMSGTPPARRGSSSGSGSVSTITGSGGLSGALGSSGAAAAASGAYANPASSSGSIGPSGSLGSSSGSLGSTLGGNSSGSSGGPGLNTATDDNTPQIMLFSNGDTNSFILTMQRPNASRSVTLQSSDDGSVKVGEIVEGLNGQNGPKGGPT